jgi:hypothetical protein
VTKSAVAALVAASIALFTMDVTAAGSGAAGSYQSASSSNFCKTIKTFAVAEPPTYVTISTYHVWAKLYLPAYEKLASEAPSSSVKKLLTEIVTILKFEEHATSLTKLEKYVATNGALWKKGVLQLTESTITCATA